LINLEIDTTTIKDEQQPFKAGLSRRLISIVQAQATSFSEEKDGE